MRLQYVLCLAPGICIFSLTASARVATSSVRATAAGSTAAVIPGPSLTWDRVAGATITRKTNEFGAAVFNLLRIGHSSMGNASQDLKLTAFRYGAGSSRRQRVLVEARFPGRSR